MNAGSDVPLQSLDDIGNEVLSGVLSINSEQEQAIRNRHIRLRTVISRKQAGEQTSEKNILKFVCSDSRVVPAVMDEGDNFIINISIAGQAIGPDFPFVALVDTMPYLDLIVMESHDDCGACRACSHRQGGEGGNLGILLDAVAGDIAQSRGKQIATLIQQIGEQLPVIGAHNHIHAQTGQKRYELDLM
ncbi:MAG TPA: hypothetical protein PKL83_06510, partial [bacterium]|nr:hypothetical protein [bacterium]